MDLNTRGKHLIITLKCVDWTSAADVLAEVQHRGVEGFKLTKVTITPRDRTGKRCILEFRLTPRNGEEQPKEDQIAKWFEIHKQGALGQDVY